MKIGIIIMGHGHFGSGMYSTLELIGGRQEHVKWIDFTEDKEMDGLLSELKETCETMESCEKILVACDLDGGTPYKSALVYSMDHTKLEIVSGISFPFLLECSLSREYAEDIDSLLEHAMDGARTALKRFDRTRLEL